MEWAAVGTLLLSGFFGLSHTTPEKVFHFISDKMNMPSARNHCTEHFVDLVSIADGTDLALLSGLVETGDGHGFVGLRREWQWDILDTEDQREAELKFNRLEDGEPQERGVCGMITPSGDWTTSKCYNNLPFICFDENSSVRFVKRNESLKYIDAREFCRQHYTDLARIQNEEENQHVASLCAGTQAWIALIKTWAWSDGTFAAYSPWSSNPTKEDDCAALHITGEPLGIVGWDCNSTLPFFCYSYALKKHTVRFTLAASEAEDLAGSAADSVIKLVQHKLSERGFTEGVRLSWSKRPQKLKSPPAPQELQCPQKIGP